MINRVKFLMLTIMSVLFVSCINQSPKEKHITNVEKEYTETFEDVGFSIKTPCKLEDVSAQATGDFLINYGGIDNPNDRNAMTVYQVIVTRLPIGYKDFSNEDLNKKVNESLQKASSNLENVKKVTFGYEEYPAYVGYATHNGLQQKGIMIAKENYVIALTIMTNSDLESKFNKFTNGFKTLKGEKQILNKVEGVTKDNTLKITSRFPNKFSSSILSLNYPSSWEIVQKNTAAGNNSTVIVQIMKKRTNNVDFAPNINVVTSKQSHSESTSELARICFNQINEAGLDCNLKGIKQCNIGGFKGHVVEYTAVVQNYTLHIYQYIIKKKNNKTFTTTVTLDDKLITSQKPITDDIIKTIVWH